jgi:hypothetical protein
VATAYNKMPYSGKITVANITGLADNNNVKSYNAYPTPATDVLNISLDLYKADVLKISLFNYTGQEVMIINNDQAAEGAYTKRVDVSSLAAGAYLLKIQSGNFVTARHIIVQH